MNTFKTVVMICAMLAASCSGQYMSHQGSHSGSSSLGGQYASQGQQAVLNTGALPLEQQRPAASPAFVAEQSIPASSPVSGAGTVTATQQICSCVTINPAASAHQAPASSAQESVAPAAAQQSFAAAPQQTFAAPQQTFAAPQQSFAAAQQQAYAAPQSTQTQGRY
ncbi:Uncharacterized protein APZ42_030917 [Daphnia magna]|uniref:Uncharacterized protein n=1 Tax=Daphnia magna TaxID=35525 RepID=A0A164NF86_9CRUS|nr:Uncharacterized protein APZ42_030917 [Daphnia magna]